MIVRGDRNYKFRWLNKKIVRWVWQFMLLINVIRIFQAWQRWTWYLVNCKWFGCLTTIIELLYQTALARNDELVGITQTCFVHRWSSQSQLTLTDDESGPGSNQSSGYPTPSYGGTRPASETNSGSNSTSYSYLQSCSSALSGMDDQKLDDILADGITNQPIQENLVLLLKF